jgi:hypothetical protein
MNSSKFSLPLYKIAYEKNTGLNSISLPLRFKSQAISSRAVIKRQSASLPSFSMTLSYFSKVVKPVYFYIKWKTGLTGRAGLALPQTISTRFGVDSTKRPFFLRGPKRVSNIKAGYYVKSRPIF